MIVVCSSLGQICFGKLSLISRCWATGFLFETCPQGHFSLEMIYLWTMARLPTSDQVFAGKDGKRR